MRVDTTTETDEKKGRGTGDGTAPGLEARDFPLKAEKPFPPLSDIGAAGGGGGGGVEEGASRVRCDDCASAEWERRRRRVPSSSFSGVVRSFRVAELGREFRDSQPNIRWLGWPGGSRTRDVRLGLPTPRLFLSFFFIIQLDLGCILAYFLLGPLVSSQSWVIGRDRHGWY